MTTVETCPGCSFAHRQLSDFTYCPKCGIELPLKPLDELAKYLRKRRDEASGRVDTYQQQGNAAGAEKSRETVAQFNRFLNRFLKALNEVQDESPQEPA